MTRQVAYVFLGHWRGHGTAHESPNVMTVPLAILAFFAMALGLLGTPAWPWFHAFLEGRSTRFEWHILVEPGLLGLMLTSTAVVLAGIFLGLKIYGDRSPKPEAPDVLEKFAPMPWRWLRDRLYVDEFYALTVIAFYTWWARVADWLDRKVWGGAVASVASVFRGWAHLNRFLDANVVDGSFDKGCDEISSSGGLLALLQTGRVQTYLRILALAIVVLTAILIWSSRA
jgi:NADH-quinone oxidoreductase subunit L